MATRHETLPAWNDKDSEQKREVLEQLWHDLTVYAAAKGISLDVEADVDFNGNHDAVRQQILAKYREVLREEAEQISQLLKAHPAADANEEEGIRRILQLLEDNPNLFNMNCEPGHFTGSALIVDVNAGKVLLHLHKKLGKWLQFGGHADYETNLFEAAIRETKEETGLEDLFSLADDFSNPSPVDIDTHLIPEGKGRPEHWHLDFRYVLGTRSPEAVMVDAEHESDNFEWFAFDEALTLTDRIDPSLMRLIKKAQRLYVELNF